ncbi:MAG: hypothetical protein JW969_19620 [Spirochaetales bacterium]|nr:hypothetical protein [Spirochaetales bacterium]
MENYFDIRTLSYITSIVAMSVFISMLYVLFKRKIYSGFVEWTIGAFVNSLGMILLGMRNILPDFFTVIIANSLILSYVIFINRGLARFSDAVQYTWLDITVCALFAGFFWFFTFIDPNVNMRIMIISAFIFLLCSRGCYLIWTKMPLVLPNRPVMLFFTYAVLGGWHLFRLVFTALAEAHIQDFMNAGFIQAMAFIVLFSANIIIGMLLLICNAGRLEVDLLEANEEIKTLSGLLPICSGCKRIRDKDGDWKQVEKYISTHSDALFTHSLCPDCIKKMYPEVK